MLAFGSPACAQPQPDNVDVPEVIDEQPASQQAAQQAAPIQASVNLDAAGLQLPDVPKTSEGAPHVCQGQEERPSSPRRSRSHRRSLSKRALTSDWRPSAESDEPDISLSPLDGSETGCDRQAPHSAATEQSAKHRGKLSGEPTTHGTSVASQDAPPPTPTATVSPSLTELLTDTAHTLAFDTLPEKFVHRLTSAPSTEHQPAHPSIAGGSPVSPTGALPAVRASVDVGVAPTPEITASAPTPAAPTRARKPFALPATPWSTEALESRMDKLSTLELPRFDGGNSDLPALVFTADAVDALAAGFLSVPNLKRPPWQKLHSSENLKGMLGTASGIGLGLSSTACQPGNAGDAAPRAPPGAPQPQTPAAAESSFQTLCLSDFRSPKRPSLGAAMRVGAGPRNTLLCPDSEDEGPEITLGHCACPPECQPSSPVSPATALPDKPASGASVMKCMNATPSATSYGKEITKQPVSAADVSAQQGHSEEIASVAVKRPRTSAGAPTRAGDTPREAGTTLDEQQEEVVPGNPVHDLKCPRYSF